MSNFQEMFFSECRKKWWFILVCAIVAALLLIVEKTLFTDTVVKSGRFYIERTVSVEYVDKENIPVYADYNHLFMGYGDLANFMEFSRGRVDFSKFDAGWGNKSQLSRLQWLEKHIRFVTISPFVFQYEIHLKEEELKDASQLEELGKECIDAWVDFTRDRLEKVGYTTKINTVDEYVLLPETQVISKINVIIKYGVVGIVLGGMLGLMIICVNALRKRDHA